MAAISHSPATRRKPRCYYARRTGPRPRRTTMRNAALLAVCTTLALLAGPALAQPLPQARPEQVGLSSERLGQVGRVLREEIEKGKFPGAVALVARKGTHRLLRELRGARSRDPRPDDPGLHLPHLLDDQADHLGRDHDAAGAGPARPHRPGL